MKTNVFLYNRDKNYKLIVFDDVYKLFHTSSQYIINDDGGYKIMPNLTYEVEINLAIEKVYEISQDYSQRYDWDPFPETIEFIGDATTVERGNKVKIVAKSGLKMEVEFVQVSPPEVTAIKMLNGPFILKSFAGSWLFKALPNGNTKAIFKYTIKTKKWALPLVSNKLINWYFGSHVKARLDALKQYCEEDRVKSNSFPPNMHKQSKVILFDGVCKLCNAWSRFIIKYDKNRVFKLASVQSREGQLILNYFKMPTDHFDTMLYVEGNCSYEKSDAFFEIVKQLNQPWKVLYKLKVLPKGIRDWCYDRIALNRYSLFGKYEQCLLPTPDHNQRFLKNEQ